MRTCGALALRSASFGFPACAWPPASASTRTQSRPVGVLGPRACARSLTIGSWYHISITTSLPARIILIALGRSRVMNIYVVHAN
eukprot:663806-Pleurochrysis_carterae.AAC.1